MKLARWMLLNGVSDPQMAEALHCTRFSVMRFRRGTIQPSWPTMLLIMEVTDGEVTPNDFLPEGMKPAAQTERTTVV